MKRVIFIALLLISFMAVSAQEQLGSPTVTEAERIIDKYLDKAGDALNSLAEVLKVPAEHVYGVLVKQQVVVGVGSLIVLIIFAVAFFLSMWGFAKRERSNEYEENLGLLVLAVFSGIGFVVSLVVFFVSGLSGLLNPEYGAIQDILSVLN